MAPKDFEHIVQSRFEGFESAPPESVWTNVNSFRDRRRKRLLFLWWLLPVLAIASGVTALYGVNASNELQEFKYSSLFEIENIDLQEHYINPNKPKVESINTIDSNSSDSKSTAASYSTTINTTTSSATVAAPVPNPKRIVPQEEIMPKAKDQIALSKMRALPVEIPETSYEPNIYWFDGIRRDTRYLWQKSIGLRLGTFVSISRPNAEWAEPLPNMLLAEDKNLNNASYHRFLEIAPYYQWKHLSTGIAIRTQLLYSAANIVAVYQQNRFSGNQQSYGLGVGGSYTFVRGRFRAAAYLELQGERLLTRYINDESFPLFPDNTGGGIQSPPNNAIATTPSRYNQWALSGEAGLRFEYVLPNPWWSLHAGAGYRNYFWREDVMTSTNTAIIDLPQLIQFNLGLSYQF